MQQQAEVNTRLGRLRGSVLQNIDGTDFYSFKGVPYAKPPVGQLRFKDPIPLEPWTGTRDALQFGPVSAQYDIVSKIADGSDDCLYLNVYTKSIDSNVRRPVMFYIHGGGFFFGSGNDMFYGPDYLMKKDVVLVTINYRLGVLGFLNLQHETAPGNQGLKDQVMALQWVRDNIANFGGDPENITIFGESAGGASVHYLTLSPLARGLFHKAISQSGVALNPWASVHGDPKVAAYKMCTFLGKDTTNPEEIVEFLRTVDVAKLIEVQGQIAQVNLAKKLLCIFGPGVDDRSSSPFLPLPLEVLVEQGAHVPYLLGHTDREGSFIYKTFEADNYEDRDRNFEEYLNPNTLDMLKGYNLTPEDLKYLYFKNEKITKESTEGLIDLTSDLLFVEGIHRIAKIQVELNSAPTYMYQFTYDKGPSFARSLFNYHGYGATHMDELLYLFSMKFHETLKVEPFKKGTKEYKMMDQMLELWTNFAKTGRPTLSTSELVPVYWKPVIDGTVFRYMRIGDDLRMEKMLSIEERYAYKKNSYQKHF